MREEFASAIRELMKRRKNIWVLLGGVGYGLWEENERVINCEASEQAMVDIAVGLALSGQIPFVYGITPHLFRAFESMRLYMEYENLNVKLVGVGRGKDYDKLGFTHWADDLDRVLKSFPSIHVVKPETREELYWQLQSIVVDKCPDFISLTRT